MDRNIHKQLYGGGTRESPGLPRASLPSMDSTRKSFFGGNAAFSPGNLRKTVLSNSRLSLSVRSTQSIPGIKSDYNVVESYGSPLPVAINEALTFKDGTSNISANCAKNGWAWVVHLRRLLIWQYKETSNSPPRSGKWPRRGGPLATCRELTLPYSDIGHKSELVSVFQVEGQQMASCIAVSATGDVRYWASIAHDGNSVDLANILDGQEFAQLVDLPTQRGYLAITTTCNLVFLRVGLNNGRYVLHHKAIKPATSFLSGFGKKFASIIIGMNNGSEKEQILVGMCNETNNPTEGESIVAVLSDRSLQRWRLNDNCKSEQLIYEDSEIVRKIREEFLQKIWNARLPADGAEIQLHLLDFSMIKIKAYILAGAVNLAHAPQMCYAVVVANVGPESMQLESFTPLKLNKFYSANTEQECLSLRFIVSSTHIYLYTPKVVFPLNLSNMASVNDLEAEKIEFHMHEDRILCAAISNHLPIFFSRTHGLVSVTPGDFDSTDLMNLSTGNAPDIFSAYSMNASFNIAEPTNTNISTNNLHIFELDPDDVYNDLGDEIGQLKAAFLYRLKRNNNMVTTIITELLRNVTESDPNGAPVDAYKLDRIVIIIAEDLAEDLPIGDPRWEGASQEINRHALGSSRSMQIINQLRDKSLAMQHFIDFLHSSGVWDKLNAVPFGNNVLKPTNFILSDISEKIVAAMALRSCQNKLSAIIENAIEATVSNWDEQPDGNLTVQDIFYVKLCKFQNIYESLADIAQDCIGTQTQTTSSVANLIHDINSIVLGTLGQVLTFREQHASIFMLTGDGLDTYENQPWTAMSGNLGVRDTLTRLIDITVRYGAQCVAEAQLKQTLFYQIKEMIDIVLEGRKNYMESVRDKEKRNVLQQQFEAQRRELIFLLIKDKQYEFAAKLAEKYLDFQSLVVICDETDDKDRLDNYTRKYAEFDFSQFAINWHLRQNRHGEVFERFKGNQNALAQFMSDHPSIGWIQLIFNGDFERAAKILYDLALCETELVARKKSMLSLAKLSAYASSDSEFTTLVEKINSELTIIEYQAQLGYDVLKNFGLETTGQKVLKVEEIIDLYITEENDTATEVEFRKALSLLSYVDHPYDIRHKIWCTAIRRDNWMNYDANNALDYIQNLLFYKIVESSHVMGLDFDSCLPPIEDFFNSSELDDLRTEKSFQYLLKLVYEYVDETFKQPDEIMEE